MTLNGFIDFLRLSPIERAFSSLDALARVILVKLIHFKKERFSNESVESSSTTGKSPSESGEDCSQARIFV